MRELTSEDWQAIRDEADFLYTCKGWDYQAAFVEAMVRIKKVLEESLQ